MRLRELYAIEMEILEKKLDEKGLSIVKKR